MRKEDKIPPVTFNNILILIFAFGSTNILYIIFWKNNPIEYTEEKNTKIIQFETKPKNIEDLLINIYRQKKSLETGSFSIKDAKNIIHKNSIFLENNKFNGNLLGNYLKKIHQETKVLIKKYDFIEYTRKKASEDQFLYLINNSLEEINLSSEINSYINNLDKEIYCETYVINTEPENYNFTKNEIKKFIELEKHKKVFDYIIPEKRSGYIISIKMIKTGSNTKFLETIKYFLKQYDNKINNINLFYKYLTEAKESSENFSQEIDFKICLEKSRNRVNFEDWSEYVSIENFFQVENSEASSLLFKQDKQNIYKKEFVVMGNMYVRAFVTEIISSKSTKIDDNFLKNIVIPSWKAYKYKEQIIKNTYKVKNEHNTGIIPIEKNKLAVKKSSFIVNHSSHLYKSLLFIDNNNVIISEDGYGNIFLIKKIYVKKTSKKIFDTSIKNFLEKKIEEYFYSYIFYKIFEIAYSKMQEIKNT